jgi:ribosomal-protein-alanine N-acetyltransferase
MFVGATRNLIGRTRKRSEMALPADHFTIRPLHQVNPDAVAALESRCEGASKWGETFYREARKRGFGGWAVVRGSDTNVIGFVLTRVVADEMEILNLGVAPEARRQEIATWLIARTLEELRETDVNRIYLEVRESNAAARGFYSSMGFEEQGRRKNYYSQPVEDALLLVLVLC